jgi:Ca2+-binding EF-hand superfamily protein
VFDIFDKDGNGTIDHAELIAGLSVLCGGSSHSKVRTAFSMFDTNGDGFIDMDEMASYLTSVFKVRSCARRLCRCLPRTAPSTVLAVCT